MASTPIYKFVGQSFALDCGTAVSGPVTVTGTETQTMAFINSTLTSAAVTMTSLNAMSAPDGFIFPVSGAPSVVSCFILPPLMEMPIVVVVPNGGFNVWGIGQTAMPTIQMTRCEIMS